MTFSFTADGAEVEAPEDGYRLTGCSGRNAEIREEAVRLR